MVPTKPVFITLQQFLKKVDVAQSGGHAKVMIVSGDVVVNGVVETRRGRKLYAGDIVKVDGKSFVVS